MCATTLIRDTLVTTTVFRDPAAGNPKQILVADGSGDGVLILNHEVVCSISGGIASSDSNARGAIRITSSFGTNGVSVLGPCGTAVHMADGKGATILCGAQGSLTVNVGKDSLGRIQSVVINKTGSLNCYSTDGTNPSLVDLSFYAPPGSLVKYGSKGEFIGTVRSDDAVATLVGNNSSVVLAGSGDGATVVGSNNSIRVVSDSSSVGVRWSAQKALLGPSTSVLVDGASGKVSVVEIGQPPRTDGSAQGSNGSPTPGTPGYNPTAAFGGGAPEQSPGFGSPLDEAGPTYLSSAFALLTPL